MTPVAGAERPEVGPPHPLMVVGLGNFGGRYDSTRHNVGFEVVDRLARRCGIAVDRRKFNGLYGQGRHEGRPLYVVKPQTYMNLSGEAVVPLARYFQVPVQGLLVVCDDFALPLGKLRMRARGSEGGHNGLRSLIGLLGTQEFARLRLGVGPVPPFMDCADFVLSRFASDEVPAVREMVERADEAVGAWMTDGMDRAMTRFNG